jgi:hypothetical protein
MAKEVERKSIILTVFLSKPSITNYRESTFMLTFILSVVIWKKLAEKILEDEIFAIVILQIILLNLITLLEYIL